jgi:antimicrobial peptide system SdpA family protein
MQSRAHLPLVAALLCVLGVLGTLYGLHAVTGFNPLRLPNEKSVDIQSWAPQGWKFFTRDPREDWTLLFARRADGTWVDASAGPNFQVGSLFGLSRAPRAQGIEMGTLLYGFRPNQWRPCTRTPVECLPDVPVQSRVVRNRTPRPTLCGDVAIVLQQQIPWAWARSRPLMPSRILRMYVEC